MTAVIFRMILHLGLRRIVRLDLLPHSLVVILGETRDGERGPHAECGVWWTEESNLSRQMHRVKPVSISDDFAQAHGFESEALYPIQPPSGLAPPSQVRRYHYLCYGWRNDVYLPHSFVHTFTLIEHGGPGERLWELSRDAEGWVLPGFDPLVDPIAGLAVHEIMEG